MKISKSGVILSAVVFLGIFSALWFFLINPYLKGREIQIGEITVSNNTGYNADAEVEEALAVFSNDIEGAKIIQDYKEPDMEKPVVSIIFQGLSDDNELNEKVLTILKDYEVNATFFVSGIDAAENSDFILQILDGGFSIGNNGLYGERAFEQYSGEEVVENLVRSGKILETITNSDINIALLNSTFYTNNICQAGAASGYDYFVFPKTGHYINYSSFNSYQQTLEYIDKLQGNVILVIKMDGPLDEIEYETSDVDLKPAEDMQPSTIVISENEVEEVKTIEQNLVWLLDGLKEKEIETQSVSDMESMSFDEYIAMLLESGISTEAFAYESIYMQMNLVAFTFEGVCDDSVYDEINELLAENSCGATFVYSEDQIDECAELIKRIKADGYEIGISDAGDGYKDKTAAECYEEISIIYRKLVTSAGVKVTVVMPSDKVVTKELKQAVGVLGYNLINPISAPTYNSGVFFRFNYNEDEFDAEYLSKEIQNILENNLLIVSASEMIKSKDEIPEIDQELIDELRVANDGKLASTKKHIRTSYRGLVFAFYGVSNKPAVKDIVDILNERDYTGTFFVTLNELINESEQIEYLIENGEEIGIAYVPSEKYPEDFDNVAKYIITCQNYLEWRYSITTKLVKFPFGSPTDETLEAVAATSCSLIGHDYSMVRSAEKDVTSADFYFSSNYSARTARFHRGSVVYFNINFYQCDVDLEDDYEGDTIVGQLVRNVIINQIDSIMYVGPDGVPAKDSAYTVQSYSKIKSAPGAYSFWYPTSSEIKVDNTILGQLPSQVEVFEYMAANYVGNPNISSVANLPGFTEEEIANYIDSTGIFTNDRVIFLTFDDWGSDPTINSILYVLDKYDVRATFFVETENVYSNPNLLRAIAVAGHQVGSHTDGHLPLANTSATELYTYESLTEDQAWALRNDIVKSYNTLYNIIGDVKVNGVYSLSKMFRPPTLAVSRIGMYQVFDVGYEYIVSGGFSTNDYAAESLEELVETLSSSTPTWYGTREVTNGTILVMHMSDTSPYTAQALDIMIPIWQAQGYSFARLDDYLH